jgi:hypothetical protein
MTKSSFRIRATQSLQALAVLGVMACAGIESKYPASPVDAQGRLTGTRTTSSGLAISGEELRSYASDYFGLALNFGHPARNASVTIPHGADLDAWYVATLQRNDIRDTNHATALGVLFALGETIAIAGAVTEERQVAAAGSAVALGATTAALVDGQDRRVQSAESVRVVPESHLLAVPFAVAPGLFKKKWVLLQTQSRSSPCISSMLIDYDVQERGRERALVPFRSELDSSAWQHRVCRPASLSAQPRAARTRGVRRKQFPRRGKP